MATSPTKSITTALNTASGSLSSVANKVRRTLTADGWRVVRASKVQRLEELLNDVVYVDSRRKRQVEALEEARKIVNSL